MLMSGTTPAAAWAALNVPSESTTYSDWGRNVDAAAMPIMCITAVTITENGVTAVANPVASEAIDSTTDDDHKTSAAEALFGGDPDATDNES